VCERGRKGKLGTLKLFAQSTIGSLKTWINLLAPEFDI
jgi:hypothetical protein